MGVAVVAQAAADLRGGATAWLNGYWSMIRWHLASLRIWLAVLTAIQVLAGAGFVLGIALFFAHIPVSAALFVTTGVPVINLIMLGLLVGPQPLVGTLLFWRLERIIYFIRRKNA